MSSDDLFAAEEEVIAAARAAARQWQLCRVADDGKHFEQLLKELSEAVPHHAPADAPQRPQRAAAQRLGRSTPANEIIAQKNKELEALSTKLSKYLSPQIYNSIFTGAQSVEIASSRKKLTIFFSDVVNFTETTDKLESEDLTNLLNRYLTEMSNIALEHGATIDKYIGDAIMVFFGDPEIEGREGGRACLRAHGHRHAAAHARAARRVAGARRREAVPAPHRHQYRLLAPSAISAATTAWTTPSSATP